MSQATTAQEYAARYRDAFEHGGLMQGDWHSERDGREVACALGVIGKDVNGPSKCPAQIMPRWLAQMVPGFFDRQKEADAFAWGLAFTAELARINGAVPFSVVHDWHANTVCQLGIDAAEKCGRDTAPHKALQALHLRALAGEKIHADGYERTSPVCTYPADAFADANANANANANAYADAYADAFADANAYAFADANANAYAYAYAFAWKLLADGMVAALSRVEAV